MTKIKAAIQIGLQAGLTALPLQSPQNNPIALVEFKAFAFHCDETKPSHLPGLANQTQANQPENSTPAEDPMPHMELDPYSIAWVETSPKSSPMFPVALRLHEETYAHLHVQKPINHPSSKLKVGQAKESPEVYTKAVADTGAHINILSLNHT